MKKALYLLSLGFGLCIAIYFYVFNFDHMSETMLVNCVLYWYAPLIFGLYGLTARRIHSTIGDSENTAIQHLFSGDTFMIVLAIILMLIGGIIGILMFFLPLLIFKPKTENFDLNVAISGTIIWLIFLYVFFLVLWPSL